MIGQVIGSYRVNKALGEGGMSQVWLGTTVSATTYLPENYSVVLKVMSSELAGDSTAQKRFVKEAQILSKLRHRFITRFYEYIPRDEGAVLVMEYVDGEPIDQMISERGALRVGDAIAVAQALLEALVYAHGRSIVHRDIKPANVIRMSDGTVKVMDFGIAKIRDQNGGAAQTVLTRSGFLLGTPHYMSPEQIRDPAAAGASADVYSAGVVLYEMLAGVLPFNSRSLPKLIESIYKGEKPRLSDLRPEVDRELEQIVLRSLEPDMSKRFASAREFYESLEEYNLRPTPIMTQKPASQSVTRPPAQMTPIPAADIHKLVRKDLSERHLLKGETFLVGRDRTCGIVVSHPAVSRRHARITLDGSGLLLEDLKSANGTYVNEARVERATLKPGDLVRFGADPSCTYIVEREAAR